MLHSLPIFLIGVVMLIYWLRVMWMVGRTPRAAGHHANFIPEEKLGRILRIVWMPVVVMWIFLPLLYGLGLIGASIFAPLFVAPAVQWGALAVVLIAFALTWVCWFRMGKSWRMGIDPREKTQLVLTGPFAYVRHPIYGLSSLIMLMTMLAYPSIAMIVVGLLHLILLQWEVRREDVYLTHVHGEPYARYRERVGRFLPRSTRPYQADLA